MSADREQDHLDMMSNMVDRHHNQPAAYFDAYEFDGNDQNGGVPCEGNGGRLLTESPSNFELEPEDVVLDRLHLEHAAMDAGTRGNAEPCTVATVPSEPSVLADELEPEAIVMDRMQAELESAWEALRHTNAGEVAR